LFVGKAAAPAEKAARQGKSSNRKWWCLAPATFARMQLPENIDGLSPAELKLLEKVADLH
jgi:hypothetical protein